VPVTASDIWPVISEAKFLFTGCEVKHLRCWVSRAWKKFETRVRERNITDCTRSVRLKLIFLSKFYVWINYKALLISGDDKLLVIGKTNGLDGSFSMHRVLVGEHELRLSLPFKNLTLWCACY
jgi:hypothetical protein